MAGPAARGKMQRMLARLPLPGGSKKPGPAQARLQAQNRWQNEPDFHTALSDSDDDMRAGGDSGQVAALNSANLRAFKGRPVTNEGQRKLRAEQNAKEWIHSSPAPAPAGSPSRYINEDESDDDVLSSSPLAASSRYESRGASRGTRRGADDDDADSHRHKVVPFGARWEHGAARREDGSAGNGSDDALNHDYGQQGFEELQRQRSDNMDAGNGKRKKSARSRAQSAGRKVTYQLTDDSESMDDMENLPHHFGLMQGIHRGPSYHDPLEREVSMTLDVYTSSRNKVSKSRGSSRGVSYREHDSEQNSARGGANFLNSERSMLSTMDSPNARARAFTAADDLLDMYAPPPGASRAAAPDSHRSVRSPQSSMRLASSQYPKARPKSVLKNSSAVFSADEGSGARSSSGPQAGMPPRLQYANGLGATQHYNISDSSEPESDGESRVDPRDGRRLQSRSELHGHYEDDVSAHGAGASSRLSQQPSARSSASRSRARTEGSCSQYGVGATDTLARTLDTIGTRNPAYLPDLDDSDSDVLRQSTDTDGESVPDTMRRLEVAHAKSAPFKLEGTADFDQFMKAVDKSVNKAVKVEKLSHKSRSGSRLGSRAASRGGERFPSRTTSGSEVRQLKQAGANVVSTSSAPEIQPRPGQTMASGGQHGYVPPSRPGTQHSEDLHAPKVVKELGATVALRRQHLAQLENGRSVPNMPSQAPARGKAMAQPSSRENVMNADSPMRRPATSRAEIALAEQEEEMEMLQQRQKAAMEKEREQVEILNRLKRDTSRKETKFKTNQQQLEELWEEQMRKDDVQYRQQKEIERLRHTLAVRDEKERAQAEELERLRRDVEERARADVDGAAAFDRLLQEKHKKLFFTPAEIRQQVDEEMQRKQVEKERAEELRAVQARQQAESQQAEKEVMLQAYHEQIERDGSKYALDGKTISDALLHGKSRHRDKDGIAAPTSVPSQFASPEQELSRPATKVSSQRDRSRPGTAATDFTVDSTSTSIREVKEASQAAAHIKKQVKQTSAQSKFQAQSIPGYVHGRNQAGAGEADSSTAIQANKIKTKAVASKETPDIAKERYQTVKKLNLDAIKSKNEKAPTLKQYESEQLVRDHATELQRATDDARHKSDLKEAQRFLEDPSGARAAKSRASQRAVSTASTRTSSSVFNDLPPALRDEMQRLEEDKTEFERREMLHDEYIEQLKHEQEEKLEREAQKRRALQELRGENSIIDKMLRETDQLEGGLIKEVGTLEALKEQFRRKQKLAEQLKLQQVELAEKQKEREAQLQQLKSQVGKASDAAGIQLMQMNRLKAIQEEAIYMQEQQHKELENLKAELKRKADITGEQEEINKLRAEMKARESEQAEAREKLRQEKALLEEAMKANEKTEKEMQKLQAEKVKREEAERNLRQMLAMEAREMQRLQEEATNRKLELEALQAEREATLKEIEGSAKEKMEKELEELRRRKEQLAENESQIAREKQELEQLNHRREEELRELEQLRKRSEEIERKQRQAKKEEEEALRIKEKQEKARLRAEEDRIRAALEHEAQKAQREMEREKKKRQNEIERLKKEIADKKISESMSIEEEEDGEEDPDEKSSKQKVSDWLQSNDPDDVDEAKHRAKKEKKKKKSSAGNITARSENDDDDDGGHGNGNDTDRSDASGKGPPTQWRLARHGKIKDLEAMLTAENVDDRDGKDNTCLHHACMQGKKRVAKMLLRLGADINAQNRRGHTCLHYCFAYGYEELGEYLITKGADESILNEMGATCREVESGSVTSRGEAA